MKVSIGEKKTFVSAELNKLGNDFSVKIWNKEGAHIGAVCIAVKGKLINSVKFPHHKEHIVFEPIAKTLSKKLNAKIIVFGGVHVDNPTKKELNELIKNIKKLPEKLMGR
ncbi:MAG: hypothetical protein JW703_00970 [Candidatus Diapherotrites archaeon]|nr:hypothetical protein [Candidatus Diapherotrites archaeon]